MKKKPFGALIGFALLGIGLTSIILNMTGLQLAFMSFMSYFSEAIGFLIYLMMMITGGVIMYLSLTRWKG
jgi:energy-converting hydrogenase Eha subunit C